MTFAPGLIQTSLPLASVLDIYSTRLLVDVVMTNANQYYDGPTLVLGKSGTYLVLGALTVNYVSGGTFVVKLHDGTTAYATGNGPGGIGTIQLWFTIPVFAIITLVTNPVTLRLSAADASTGGTIKATPSILSPGNFASYLLAVRLGP